MLNGTMKFLLSFSFEQFTFTARFFYPTKLIEVLEKMKVIVRILATYSVCVDVYVRRILRGKLSMERDDIPAYLKF